MYYSRAWSGVVQKSTSLKYEPSSELNVDHTWQMQQQQQLVQQQQGVQQAGGQQGGAQPQSQQVPSRFRAVLSSLEAFFWTTALSSGQHDERIFPSCHASAMTATHATILVYRFMYFATTCDPRYQRHMLSWIRELWSFFVYIPRQ